MTHHDSLRRSMHVAPEPWLDQRVTDRVRSLVQRTAAAPSPAPLAAAPAWKGALAQAQRLRARIVLQARARAWLGWLASPDARMLLWRGSDQRG